MNCLKSPLCAYQLRCISRYVKDADHAISSCPISDSIVANSRAAPIGAMSPYPSEVYVASEKYRMSVGPDFTPERVAMSMARR